MTTVLVLAQGSGRRWNDASGRPYMGVPKHLVDVEGETVIGRIVRLFTERGCNVVVVGPDDDRYRIDGASLVTLDNPNPNGRESVDKFLGCKDLWNRDGRTIIVWGDCYYTDHAADLIAGHDQPGLHYFRRPGKSKVTGHKHDESFAVTFTPDAHDDVVKACKRVMAELHSSKIDHIYQHYAAHLGMPDLSDVKAVYDTPGQTHIDDWTDDFDKPSEYRQWLQRRARARRNEPNVRVSATIMAHPSRTGWAEQLSATLGCGITWDDKNVLWDTARRSWLAYDRDATHHLVVQDDAIVSRDLMAAAAEVAANAGERPVSFYFGGVRPRLPETESRLRKARTLGLSWVEMDGPLWAVALMLPTSHIDEMVKFGDRKPTIPADDSKIARFYLSRGMQCWYTVPSLVDHRTENNPSLAGTRVSGRPRCSQWFIGEDGSGLDVDWSLLPDGYAQKGGPMKTYRHVRTGKEVRVVDGSSAEARLAAKPNHWEAVSRDVDVTVTATVENYVDALAAAHLGAGWYQTPDGDKVRGRAAAEAAWSAA